MDRFKNDPEMSGYALVFAGGILWGLVGFFFRLMDSAGAEVLLTGFLRTFFAFLVMLVLTVARYGFSVMLIDRHTLFHCVLIGVLCHGAYNVLYNASIKIVGVSTGAVLLYTAPVFTAVLSHHLFSEHITAAKFAALAMNIIGCILAATGGNVGIGNLSAVGLLCGIGAGFCYSLNAIIGKLIGTGKNMFVITTYGYFFAALMFLLLLIPSGEADAVNGTILMYGFLFAMIPTAFAYLIYYLGIQRIKESSKVPVAASVEVVISAFVGMIIFKEKLCPSSLTGIILVLCSILIMQKDSVFPLHITLRHH